MCVYVFGERVVVFKLVFSVVCEIMNEESKLYYTMYLRTAFNLSVRACVW
jgi:hypothetical protein